MEGYRSKDWTQTRNKGKEKGPNLPDQHQPNEHFYQAIYINNNQEGRFTECKKAAEILVVIWIATFA